MKEQIVENDEYSRTLDIFVSIGIDHEEDLIDDAQVSKRLIALSRYTNDEISIQDLNKEFK